MCAWRQLPVAGEKNSRPTSPARAMRSQLIKVMSDDSLPVWPKMDSTWRPQVGVSWEPDGRGQVSGRQDERKRVTRKKTVSYGGNVNVC